MTHAGIDTDGDGEIDFYFPHDDGGSDNDNDGGSSGGSSSGGGGGGQAYDQYLTDAFRGDAESRQMALDLARVYRDLWGTWPSESYIINAVRQGLSAAEFASQERNKEAWKSTQVYRDDVARYAQMLSSLGALGGFDVRGAKTPKELAKLGLGGQYLNLVDAAARGQFSQQEFLVRLTNTGQFRKKFPGLVQPGGELNDFLTGATGISVTDMTALRGAIQAYGQLRNAYSDIARAQGYSREMNGQLIKTLLAKEVSPDEFGNRLRAVNYVESNPGFKQAWEEQLKRAGLKADAKKGIYQFAAGVAPKRFYDVYEAAALQGANLGLSKQQAAALGRQIGERGQQFGENVYSITELANQARANLQTIGPELEAQGVSRTKLIKFLSNPAAMDSENIAGKIQQALASRQRYGAGERGPIQFQGTGGGPGLYRQEGEAAYG